MSSNQETESDRLRKAYAEGIADGKTIGYAEGFDTGYDVCANDHSLELNTGRTMRGSPEYEQALERVQGLLVPPIKM